MSLDWKIFSRKSSHIIIQIYFSDKDLEKIKELCVIRKTDSKIVDNVVLLKEFMIKSIKF